MRSVLDAQIYVLGYGQITLQTISDIATCYRKLSRHDEAIELLEMLAQKYLELGVTEDNILVILVRSAMADSMRALGQYKEAKEVYEVCLKKLISIYGEKHDHIERILFKLLECFEHLGEVSKANALAKRMKSLFG